MKRKLQAFSLLEIIFVIVMIGLIASIAVPKLFNTKTDALVNTLKQDIATVTSSIQSYYLVHSKIDEISDAVELNSAIWEIETEQISYYEDEEVCVTVTLEKEALEVNINEEVGTICQKLYDKGVRSIRYALK